MRRALFDNRVALGLLFVLLYVPFLVRSGTELASQHHSDFPTFYFAARAAFKVHLSPYQQLFAGGFSPAGDQQHYVFPYLYPPPSLLLFYPYTWLGYETAKRVQLALSHVALLAMLYIVAIGILRLQWRRRRDAVVLGLIVLATFLFTPLDVALRAGQTNVVGSLAVAAAWLGLSQRRDAGAGVSLALAGLLKTYPLLLGLVIVFQKRWRALAWMAGSLAAVTAAAAATLPRSAWSDWWTRVLPNARFGHTPAGLGSVIGPWNQSVSGFTARLFVPNEFCAALVPSAALARVAPYVIALALLAVTGVAALRAMRHTSSEANDTALADGSFTAGARTLALQVATLLLVAFMVAPISWEHHLVFVLPSVYVALHSALRRGRGLVTAAAILAATAILAAPFPIQYDSYPGIAAWLQSGVATLLISIKLFCVVGVWAILVRDLWSLGNEA